MHISHLSSSLSSVAPPTRSNTTVAVQERARFNRAVREYRNSSYRNLNNKMAHYPTHLRRNIEEVLCDYPAHLRRNIEEVLSDRT